MGGGDEQRPPQSAQSLPRLQAENSLPGPPSWQWVSAAYLHCSVQQTGVAGGGGGGTNGGGSGGGGHGGHGGAAGCGSAGGSDGQRSPQSLQSVPS
eukprot:5054309-Prymnesium_polylepis.1